MGMIYSFLAVKVPQPENQRFNMMIYGNLTYKMSNGKKVRAPLPQ
jgi:hypothetical protein